MDAAFLSVLLLLVSPAIGSFLGVLVDRLPRGESVVRPPSACRACGARLRPRDLLPVLSFAAARGRCRHCGAAIPPWLLYLEIAAAGAAAIAVILGQDAGTQAHIAAVLWLLLALGACDLLWFRLPDPLTAALFAAALLWAALHGTVPLALLGAAIGAGSFLALRLAYRRLRGREGLGLGDVKLMAGLGALAGPLALPSLVLGAALAALAHALLAPGRLHAGRALPFGAALAGSGAVCWLLTLAGTPPF